MDQSGQLRRVFTQLDEPHLLHTLESLDTVRALHQTVVALRKALESSQQEIQKLKLQITVQNEINDGKIYQSNENLLQDQIESIPSTSKDDNEQENFSSSQQEKQQHLRQVTFSDTDKIFKEKKEKVSITTKYSDDIETKEKHVSNVKDEKLKFKKRKLSKTYSAKNEQGKSIKPEHISITSYPIPSSTSPMASSKIGVKIRVSSNIQVDSSSSSELDSARSTSEDNSKSKENNNLETDEGNKTNETETSKSNLQVSVTAGSDGGDGFCSKRAGSSTSNLHLDVDNISIYSMSEGDNSVFTEGVTTPIEGIEKPETPQPKIQEHKLTHDSTSEHHEEVDDIELIFSSDENKDLTQEDLVSISDYEPWQNEGASGTPVLIKYSPLPTSMEQPTISNEPPQCFDNSTQEMKISSYAGKKVRQTQKSCNDESSEEISLERLNQSLDFATKSSSLEKDYSTHDDDDENDHNNDFVQKDESFDKFDPSESSKLGQKWKNFNVLIETDISKCGILEENLLEMGRRNTCPNPPAYRPIIHNQQQSRQQTRCPLSVKFSRSPRSQYSKQTRPILIESNQQYGPKRSSSAQTEISALPEYWRSESHLAGGCFDGFYTLPSKFVPPLLPSFRKYPLRPSDKTQEARRILLSDINFTSMVPELSRSADHLCHEEEEQNGHDNKTSDYHKGNLLKTPESFVGVTPSASMTSPGVSQWTVNDNSYGTQTTQTEYWGNNRGDSFDSCKSYSIGSKYSNGLSRHHRSRSVPSVRCAICKQAHFHSGMRTSESMHYTPRVAFQESNKNTIRGSLPDLRHDCTCLRRYGGPSLYKIHGDSEGSTDSLLDEADDFLKRSVDGALGTDSFESHGVSMPTSASSSQKRVNRRCSETDIQRDFIPSKQSLPFLPKSPKCLKPGHLAKVISKNGKVVIGRIKYIGPIILSGSNNMDEEVFIGLHLPNKFGDCDGSIDGRKFFDCEPLQGIFVPFKKIVMAWTS